MTDITARLKNGSGEDRDVDDLLAKLWFFYKARHSRGKPEETMPFGKQGGAWHLVGVLLDAIKTIERLRAPPMTAKSNSELVERLQNQLYIPPYAYGDNEAACQFVAAMKEAASALEHLEAENAKYEAHLKKAEHALLAIHNMAERLREALTKIAHADSGKTWSRDDPLANQYYAGRQGLSAIARAALAETPADLDRQGPRTDAG